MTRTVELSIYVDVTYDETSSEFQQSLESYRRLICSDADADDMVKTTVACIAQYGTDRMVEGVGYVRVGGQPCPDEGLFCGIEVESDYFPIDTNFLN
jgi:hypothetical protein